VAWVDTLRGGKVGIDTAPLIYFIEQHPVYLPVVRPFFVALDQGAFSAVTSVVTLLEVLVHPIRHGDAALAQRYRNILLQARGLVTSAITPEIAERAASLRAVHNVRTPDALQLATALEAGATVYLTNDDGLPAVPGLQLFVLDQLQTAPR
jgi:predicted nucleic acid-binding protein